MFTIHLMKSFKVFFPPNFYQTFWSCFFESRRLCPHKILKYTKKMNLIYFFLDFWKQSLWISKLKTIFVFFKNNTVLWMESQTLAGVPHQFGPHFSAGQSQKVVVVGKTTHIKLHKWASPFPPLSYVAFRVRKKEKGERKIVMTPIL